MFEKDAATEIITKSPPSIEGEGLQEEIVPEEGADGSTQEPTGTTKLRAQGHRDIKEITDDILSRKRAIVQSFLEIGNLLIEAKEQLTKHGGWLKWLDDEVDISYRMAERYMQLARSYANSKSMTNLGMTKALALLALPDPDREIFMEESHEVNGKQKKVSEMSVRELKQAIHEELRTIAKEQNPVMLEVMTNDKLVYKKVSRDLETAQELLDGIVKFLANPPRNATMPDKFSFGLCALCESVQKCMVLANLEPQSN